MEIYMYTSVLASKEHFFRAGGIRFIADLLPYLARKFDIKLFVAGKKKESFEFNGVEVEILPGKKLPFVDKALLPAVKEKPDVGLFLEYISALSQNSGKKNLVVFHHLAPSFFDENPLAYVRFFGAHGIIFLPLESLLLRKVLKKCKKALLVSDITEKYLRNLGFETLLVGNGIEVRKYGSSRKEDFAVYIGRLVNYKRVDLAIKLAERLEIELFIVGIGPERKKLEKIASKNVHFLGYLSEEEKIKLLSRARYLFNFSAFEGFNLTLLEAMASKTIPVVSFNRAHSFVLGNSGAGFLVKSLKEAEKIVNFLEENGNFRKKVAEKGRKLVEEKWNAKKVAEKYIEAIEALS